MHSADQGPDPRRNSRSENTYTLALAVMSVVVALDQIAKAVVCRYLPLEQFPHREVIPGFFALVHLRNTGAAWGVFQGRTQFLTLLSFGVLLYLARQYRHLTGTSALRRFAFGLLGGGIVGNLLDRLFRGEVVDFLLFYVGQWQWPAFNIADSGITCGVAILLLASLTDKPSEETPINEGA